MMKLKQYCLLPVMAILFAACEKEKNECPGSVERSITLANFSGITAGETFNIEIKKGNTCTIKVSGCTNDLDDLTLAVSQDNMLDISYNHYRSDRYRVDLVITLPALIAVNAGGAARVNVTGFDLQPVNLHVTAAGAAECDINGAPQFMTFAVGGTAELAITATSTISSLIGSAAGTSRIAAYQSPAKNIDIQAAGTSKVYVAPVEELKAGASGDSKIYYKGNPLKLAAQQSGEGKVIHEF